MSSITTFYFNSKDRTSGEINAPMFSFPTGISEAKSYYIKNVSIPFSSYVSIYPATGNSSTVLFAISDPSGLHNVALTSGNYGASALATLLQTALNTAVGGNSYTVTYNMNTYRYTITNNASANFTLYWDVVNQVRGHEIFYTYGFSGQLTGSSTYVSTQAATASGTSYNYYIKSQALTMGKSYSYFQNRTDSVVITVPLNVPTTGLIQYNDQLGQRIPISNTNINTVDFRLCDDYGHLVNLNGLDWTITLVVIS